MFNHQGNQWFSGVQRCFFSLISVVLVFVFRGIYHSTVTDNFEVVTHERRQSACCNCLYCIHSEMLMLYRTSCTMHPFFQRASYNQGFLFQPGNVQLSCARFRWHAVILSCPEFFFHLDHAHVSCSVQTLLA